MNKSIVCFRSIVKQADDFKYITFRLIDTGKHSIGNKCYGAQFFVNGSFAIELYLKSLLLFDNIRVPNTHMLDVLYKKLLYKRKEDLKLIYPNIEKYLKEQRDAFVKWRYSYEYGCLLGSIAEMIEVLNVFQKYCNNIIKELDNYD